jgi:prefoldin subunit 5
MPGELREKIQFWEVMNRILKNNGYLDMDAVYAEINNLKQKLNTLLSEVLGVEHSIDEIHNYDDSNLKQDIATITSDLTSLLNNINSIHADIDALNTRLGGITSTTAKIKLANSHEIDAEVYVDDNGTGTSIRMTPAMIYLVSRDDSINNDAHIVLGGGSSDDGIVIASAQPIIITNPYLNHYVRVKTNINEISDVNGLVFSYDANGYTIKTFDGNKYNTTAWTS